MNNSTESAGMKVGTRISLGFALILLMMIVLTVAGVIRVKSIEASLTTISDVNSVKQRYAINFRGSVHDRAIDLRDVTLIGNDADLKRVLADIDRLAADYADSARPLDEIFNAGRGISADERRLLDAIKASEARATPLIRKVIDSRAAGNIDEAKRIMLEEARPAFVEWLASINKFIDFQEQGIRTESARAQSTARGFQALMLLLCGGAVVIGIVVTYLVTRQIIRALGAEPAEVKALAEAVNRGELFGEVRLRPGDTDSIMATLARMSDTLRSTVARVRNAAEGVKDTSNEIGQGNRDLWSRTELQAGSLEKTSSSMEELTVTVKRNADNARQANQLAVSASAVALKGGAAVSQVVDTMAAINESAKKIVDIIGVIDGIAFQTNILALNAAVEAARAGEQGRGFAVVASEVRNLAQRSATAAKEIKTLIADSVQRVDAGAQQVDAAGATMEEIVDGVKRVTDIMGEIMAASEEQSSRIEQVYQAVGQMDDVTRQNAALVEQAAAQATSLQEQAAELTLAVGVFKLAAGEFSSARAVSVPMNNPSRANAGLVTQQVGSAPRLTAAHATR
jgi:methyl-accepting chemotaxis protein